MPTSSVQSSPNAGSNGPGVSPRRTLVTGGAGFIGSHLTELLLRRGDHITIIDDVSTGRRHNLPVTHPRLRFIEADLISALDALGKGEQFEEIYHLAAAVGVKLVVDDPIGCIETNIHGTSALLRFALRPGSSPPRVLIASSSEVYGKSDRIPFKEDDDVAYGPTTRSRWSYAQTKAIDEYLALACHAKHQLPTVVTRFFNTVGPRQVGSYGMVLPNFVAHALRGEPIPVYGDGHQIRCFCDVRDVVQVLPRLMADPAFAGQVFNVGSDRPISILDLAQLVIQTLSSRSTTRMIPYDVAYSPGFEDLVKRIPDLSKIQAAVGFAPTISLDQTIRDIAQSMSGQGSI